MLNCFMYSIQRHCEETSCSIGRIRQFQKKFLIILQQHSQHPTSPMWKCYVEDKFCLNALLALISFNNLQAKKLLLLIPSALVQKISLK